MPVVPFDQTQRATIVQNDRLPFVKATLTDLNNNPIDLSAASVTFRMVNYYTQVPQVVNGTVVILQAGPLTLGQVEYQWQPGDTSLPGLYSAWFVVTQGNLVEHFPLSPRQLLITIIAQE